MPKPEGKTRILHLDDTRDERELIKMIHEFSPHLQKVPLISCQNLTELKTALEEQNGSPALLLLDANLGNADAKGKPDYYEGVRFGLQLIKEGTRHSILFMSAHGNMVLEFIKNELTQKAALELELLRSGIVPLPNTVANSPESPPPLTAEEIAAKRQALEQQITELNALIANLNVFAGIFGKPYDEPLDVDDMMVKLVRSLKAGNSHPPFLLNLVSTEGSQIKQEFSSASSYFSAMNVLLNQTNPNTKTG